MTQLDISITLADAIIEDVLKFQGAADQFNDMTLLVAAID